MNAQRGEHAAVADVVEANIQGQLAADHLIDHVRSGVAHPDALYFAALAAWADLVSPGLLGFLRRIQKAIERSTS